jgi:Lrp/AsnC family transcriptional regulator, leucine-responsive regulatory protein
MSNQIETELDDIDWKLMQLLEQDARLSFRELGTHVNLSAPAVTKRLDRMMESGIIRGYRVEIDLAKIGLPITAFTQISVARGKSREIASQLQALPEVTDCYRISGDYSYIVKLHVASISHLESFIDRIGKLGHSTTSIVLSSTTTMPIVGKRNLIFSNRTVRHRPR